MWGWRWSLLLDSNPLKVLEPAQGEEPDRVLVTPAGMLDLLRGRMRWTRSRRPRRVWRPSRGRKDDAQGRKSGQKRNPRGGTPYKREYGEPDEKAQCNFTDPESRVMKTSSEGFQQSYNVQIAVEGENQLVGAAVTHNASDQGRLVPMVDSLRDAFGEMPEHVLADAGYCSEPDLQALKEQDIDGYVSLAREGKAVTDPDLDKYPAKARMAEKLASDEGRRRCARRKWMAEAPVGWIKEVMGFRRFSFRGLDKVEAEWARVPGAQRQAAAHASGGMRRRSVPRNCGPRGSHGSPGPRFGAMLPSRPVSGPESLPLSPRVSLARSGGAGHDPEESDTSFAPDGSLPESGMGVTW